MVNEPPRQSVRLCTKKKYSIPNVEGVFGRYRTRYHGYILLLVGAAQKLSLIHI